VSFEEGLISAKLKENFIDYMFVYVGSDSKKKLEYKGGLVI
jgi:hypothetical protein